MHISNGSGKTLFIKLIWENVNNKSIEIKGITVLTVLSAIFCRFKTFKIKSWGEIVSFHNKQLENKKAHHTTSQDAGHVEGRASSFCLKGSVPP